MAELSSRFINLTSGEVDREIEDAQRRVCEWLDIDLSALWQWSAEGPPTLTMTHVYRSVEGPPIPVGTMDARESFPWCLDELIAGRTIAVADVEQAPAEAARDREGWRHFGLKSVLTLPLSAGGGPIGALNFNAIRRRRDWPDALVKRLQLVAQVFANALARKRADDALRESEERLSLAADAAEAGLWTLEYGTGVFWVTEKARAIFGYSPDEEITRERFRAWVHPDDWGIVEGAIERSAVAGEPVDVEYRIVPPGAGRARWIHSRGRPLRGPAGGFVRLTGISFDVTERKRAEQESRERLEFETLIADLSSRFVNLPVSEVDREIEDAQRRVCEVLGLDLSALWEGEATAEGPLTLTHFYSSREDLPIPQRGMSGLELFPWLHREMRAGRTVCVSSLEDLPPEAALDRDNLRLFGVQSNLTLPLAVGGASTVAALGFNGTRAAREWPEALVKRLRLVGQVFGNALARKHAVEVLRAGQARLEAATDLAGLGFYEVDFAERTVFADDRFRDVCGIPPDVRGRASSAARVLDRAPAPGRPPTRDGPAPAAARREAGAAQRSSIATSIRPVERSGFTTWPGSPGATPPDAWSGPSAFSATSRSDGEREEALRQSLAEIERLKDRLQAESDYLKAEIRVVRQQGEVTGQSPAIQKVQRLAEQVAPTDSSVLVRGETGSGKELVAQAIHRLSSRRSKLMVKINCAALPSGLVESELFGREKGAFTGALTRQVGRFEVADGSTLFLDEVGELSLEVQAKLLRVLETGEFERLGSPKTIKVDVRVIAATNRDLTEEIRKGRFREDLYYRLNVFPIRVPPLRERAEDIPLLVWTFLEEFSSRMGKKITQVPQEDDGGAPALSLAGQRPRAAERDRARRHRHHRRHAEGADARRRRRGRGAAADPGRLRARPDPPCAREQALAHQGADGRGRRARAQPLDPLQPHEEAGHPAARAGGRTARRRSTTGSGSRSDGRRPRGATSEPLDERRRSRRGPGSRRSLPPAPPLEHQPQDARVLAVTRVVDALLDRQEVLDGDPAGPRAPVPALDAPLPCVIERERHGLAQQVDAVRGDAELEDLVPVRRVQQVGAPELGQRSVRASRGCRARDRARCRCPS